MKKKLFCVTFCNEEGWDNPTIMHIKAYTRDEAIKKAEDQFKKFSDMDSDDVHYTLAFEIKTDDIIK